MYTVVNVLIGLAILAFAAAVYSTVFGSFWIVPEAFSRASNNLALIAIALAMCGKGGSTTK